MDWQWQSTHIQSSAPSENAATRADYVVGRLAEAVSGPSQDDWAQIGKELGWAYDAIDVSQKRGRQKLKSRRVFSLLAVFATVVIVQWQVDSYCGAQEISLRTFYVPVLTAAAAPFVLVLLVAFIIFIFSLTEVVEFLSGFVFLLLGSSGLALAIYLLHRMSGYPWPHAVVIVVVESVLWFLLASLVLNFTVETVHSADDPRDQLLADLAGFLAVLAVPLHVVDTAEDWRDAEQDWRGFGSAFPAPRWSSLALVVHEDASSPTPDATSDASDDPLPRIEPDTWRSRQDERIRQVLAAEGIEIPSDRLSTSDASDDPLPHMVRIEPDAWHWRQDRLVRRALADGIEMAADRVEFTLPKVVSRAETAVRSSVRLTAAKIAATLRKYAVDVGLGGVESDQTVPPKITSALVAVAWGRWDALAIEDPQPVVERFLKRFGLRIIVAAILIAAAVLVPIWLPQWIGDASAQFRVALITAAALGLTKAPTDAVERLATYLPSLGGGRSQ
jgi:hypothetical protein